MHSVEDVEHYGKSVHAMIACPKRLQQFSMSWGRVGGTCLKCRRCIKTTVVGPGLYLCPNGKSY